MKPGHLILSFLLVPSLLAQETLEQRVERLERESRDLRKRLEEVTREPQDDEGELPAGSRKVYAVDEGISLAGYGEYIFTQNSGRSDVADALRTVIYMGYHFDERWLFHSEIEFEHGSTEEKGEVSLEFGYLEYQATDAFSIRAGMLLVPVGLTNEQHEPTMFLAASRPQTESRIIPTTWGEVGVEGLVELDAFSIRAFVGSGLDGEEFGVKGLRDGRQKASKAAADDLAAALRIDHHLSAEFSVGGSVFYQRAGQDGLRGAVAIPEMDTGIVEGHIEWIPGDLRLRALWASAFSDDAAAFAAATGRNLAERMDGFYAEVGYDIAPWLFPESDAVVIPFVRYERIDTQAKMPAGLVADPAQDNRVVTLGLHWRPIDRIVVKVDFEEWEGSFDRFNIALGYVF